MPGVQCAYDEMVKTEMLIPNPKNPNSHPGNQVRILAKIIDTQGWRSPITVSKNSGFVVRGHCKLLAAKRLGCAEVPVDYQEYENESQEWSDLIADNQVPELAEMNDEMLVELLRELDQCGSDLELTGFSLQDIDEIFGAFSPKESETKSGNTNPSPGELIKKWKVQAGVLWSVGKHRLMCGDVTNQKDVVRLLQGELGDMIFTDPPYNMDYKSKKLGGLKNDRIGEARFVRLILMATHNLIGVLKKAGSYYVCMSAAEYAMVIHQLRKLGLRGVPIIWVKPGTGLGAQEYRPQYEVILYGYTGDRKGRVWNGKRRESNLWTFDEDRGVIARETPDGGMVLEFGLGYDTVTVLFGSCMDGVVLGADSSVSDLWVIGREGGDYVHPTQKPVPLVKRAIKNSSNKGDIILDGFIGSGTAMVAAEETGRVCYGMDLDPEYVATTLERMEGLGLKPTVMGNN